MNKEICEKMYSNFEKCLEWIDENISPNLFTHIDVKWTDGNEYRYITHEFTVIPKCKINSITVTHPSYETLYRFNHGKTNGFDQLSFNAVIEFLRDWENIKGRLILHQKKDRETIELVENFQV